MISSFGFSSSARTISMRWRSPTDSVETSRCGSSFSPYCVITSRILASRSRAGILASMPERDVLEHRHRIEQREVLEHHADAELARRLGVGHPDRFTVPADLAGIGLHDPVDHLDERGFAGAVFAEQRVDFARQHRERNVVVGQNAGKALGDAGQLQPRRYFIVQKRLPTSVRWPAARPTSELPGRQCVP